MCTKILFFIIYTINIMNIYSYELNITELYDIDKTKFKNIRKIYTYDNITDYIYNYNYIYQYDDSQIRNKSDVLEIEDENSLGMSYICKNDICTEIDRNDMKFFIEIPDKNKNIKGYIMNSYNYDSIE